MAKLILSFHGAVLSEHVLNQDSISLGRRAGNTIRIENPAVSGQHAMIYKAGNGWCVEDNNSTNGTLVNSIPIKKHVLRHKDVIEFGNHQLAYMEEAAAIEGGAPAAESGQTLMMHAEPMASSPEPAPAQPAAVVAPAKPTETKAATSRQGPAGRIKMLNGPSAGKETLLNKAMTTLGKPGDHVAVITRRSQGYFLTHVDGQSHPRVNDRTIGVQAHMLNNNDLIELSGVQMKFYMGAES